MKRVFISCGQRTSAESNLGGAIHDMVPELTPFEPYFAAHQTTLEGLSVHVLRALYDSVGLISVLHARGEVTPGPFKRASVWVEQELGVAAFVTQILGRPLNVAAYIEQGVGLEGMRAQLLLSPKVFSTSQQVLEHLRLVLPTWVYKNDHTAGVWLQIEYESELLEIHRHEYSLAVILNNQSHMVLEPTHLDLRFPTRLVRRLHDNPFLLADRSNKDESVFRVTSKPPLQTCYPGDAVRLFQLPYLIDVDLIRHGDYNLHSTVSAAVYFKDRAPVSAERPMAQLQQF